MPTSRPAAAEGSFAHQATCSSWSAPQLLRWLQLPHTEHALSMAAALVALSDVELCWLHLLPALLPETQQLSPVLASLELLLQLLLAILHAQARMPHDLVRILPANTVHGPWHTH
jgi:hypothetical protein